MEWGDWWFWFLMLGVVLPIIVLALLGALIWLFGRRWVEGFIEPDSAELGRLLAERRGAQPTATRAELIEPIVRRQALKCGIAGAITGFGGFVTLPLTLPIDLMLTARYQASMVSFIAHAYGFDNSTQNKAMTYAVLSGGSQLGKLGNAALVKYLPQVAGKSVSKLIPVLGAIISFMVNYWLARVMARAATRWYARAAPSIEVT